MANFTLTDWRLFKLFECIDREARSAVVDGEMQLVKSLRGKRVVVARGRLEPMFTWRAGEAFVWKRSDLAREIPPTDDARDAGDLAWSAARYLDAFAVYRNEDKWVRRLVEAQYQALFDFETLVLDASPKREARVRKHIGWLLAQLGEALVNSFAQYGSEGGRIYAQLVSDNAVLVAAIAAHVAHDLPVRAELQALVETMTRWAVRAAIPMDEALRLSVDVKAAAKDWRAVK